jgi:hypothetical protein
MGCVTRLGVKELLDKAGSTIIPHACSHGKPVVQSVLTDELVHEQDVDPASEVTSVVVQRELMSALLLPSSQGSYIASC